MRRCSWRSAAARTLRHSRIARAEDRKQAEALLPTSLLFVKGWPTAMPTPQEAQLIADVRKRVARSVGLHINYTDAPAVLTRYAQLMAQAAAKASAHGLALSA